MKTMMLMFGLLVSTAAFAHGPGGGRGAFEAARARQDPGCERRVERDGRRDRRDDRQIARHERRQHRQDHRFGRRGR